MFQGGTDAENVFLYIYGDKGDSGELLLTDPAVSDPGVQLFQRGSTDVFRFQLFDIGTVSVIQNVRCEGYRRIQN